MEPVEPIRQIARLTPAMMKALRKQMPGPGVSQHTTELQAGFQLGIQFVLDKLQEGFTHEEA